MEYKQCTSDDLNHTPYSNQGFLADRFAKKSNNLNIPDTIPENCSEELNEDSLKMEAPKVAAETFSCEDKENICNNLQVECNESINNSTDILFDNSYIRQCERKLLESSSSEDDQSIESDKSKVNLRFVDVQRKLIYNNDTVSTPPSLLRKEISLLRNEMTEAHEFHDFEIQVLKEEKLTEADSCNYLELFEKYSTLMELYTTLKAEYDDYRKEQEKIRQEYQSKTADCLEYLCSQIEASDNSLNFSSASFVSFNGGIKCSTMMEDISEVEATVVNDATVLANDPLSITNDLVFKTPLQTPLKGPKKFEEEMNLTVSKPAIKEVKDIIAEDETAVFLDSEYNIRVLNLETVLYDKVKEVEDLERRLFRIEDLSSVLQNEFERIGSVYAKENNILKENLANKTEQLNELTQKLLTEIISINPSLRDSLNDMSGIRLLVVFIETIMESCRKIQNEEIAKHNAEKVDWETRRKSELMTIRDLQNQTTLQLAELENFKKISESLEIKLRDAENLILNKDAQIKMLESQVSNFKETQDFASVSSTLTELESRMILTEAEKKAAENRYRELETVVKHLEHEIETNGKLRLQLQAQLLAVEEKKSEIESDNNRLRQSYDTLKDQITEIENVLKSNESEIMVFKENLALANETILQLKSQLQSVEAEKTDLENRFSELQENNQHLLVEINSTKKVENISANEKILNENDNLKQKILEKEKFMAELKTELELAKEKEMNSFRMVEELTKETGDLKNEILAFSKTFDAVEESQKNLARLVLDIKNDSDLSSDRITKLIENSSKLQETTEMRGTKIISVFIETIMKTCKEVQNTLIKHYDQKKLEWEAQRDADFNLITSLQNDIKFLTEKCTQHEAKISECNIEKENLIELFENLKTQKTEAEKIYSEEIKSLKSQENILKQTKDDLAAADGTIIELKSQMLSILAQKTEVENQCRKLEENVLSFQSKIEMVTKEFDEMKIIRERIENENSDLKQQISKSENLIVTLKKNLEEAKEEQNNKEVRIQNLQNENGLLKNEQESLISLSEKLETLERNNKNLMDILSDIQHYLEMPESTVKELLANNFENKRIFSERINSLIKTQLENQFRWQETKQMEFDDLKKEYEISKEKLSDAQNMILAREEEIQTIQCELREIQENCTAAKKNLLDLKSQLTLCESEKLEVEARCHALEKINETLKLEIDASEKLRMDVQAHLSSAEKRRSELENENVRLEELCNVLRVKTTEAEGVISKLEEEIRILKLNQSSQLELEELRNLFETLREKFLDTQKVNLSRIAEIQVLQTEILNIKQSQEDLTETKEVLSDKLKFTEIERTKAEGRCCELENVIENLKQEIEIKENFLIEFKTQKTEINMENLKLKESYNALKLQMTEAENIICMKDEEISVLKSCESELNVFRENLASADKKISELKFQLKSIEVEKSEMENRCSKLQESNQNLRTEITGVKNLGNDPAYEKIQIENDDLKHRIFESDKMMTELKNELELAKKDQMNNIRKVEELIREIEELKKENIDFSHALTTLEETRKNLADVLLDVECDSDLTSDRIIKLINQNTKLSDSKTKQNKIVTDLVETITKTCKGVQNELIKKFDNKVLEWESQRDVDLQKFQEQIKLLTERNVQYEAALKQTKDSLALAEDTIVQLKSQLSLIQTEKNELEIDRQKLEEGTLILQTEIDTKETIIKGLDELKIVWKKIEIENDDLKQQTLESEKIIIRLKNCLEIKKEEQSRNETKIQDLQNEIDLLKKEQEDYRNLAEKLESIEKNNKNLLNILSGIQSHLDMPEDTLTKLMSGDFENKKIFNEKINNFAKTQMEGLKAENKHLKLGIDNLKQKVKQLTQLICETADNNLKEALSDLNSSHPYSMSLRSKSKNMDICVRRLDKLEEINHNLTEMLTRILSITEFPDLEKLKLCSVRESSNIMKKLVAHFQGLESKMKELKEENAQLDEECETYSNIIKDLKKEAAAVWKSNKEKAEALASKISQLNEEKNCLENEKQDLLAKISKLESESQKLKSTLKTEEAFHSCVCGNESKKINELKRAILVKEQKLLELQDLEAQASSYKSQIEYLKTALEREKKKVGEEKEKNKKLLNELNELTKNLKTEKKTDDNQILEELRMRGSISGGIVQEFVDKEKMRKLSKDIGILKELCRARYAEIKRLEAVNAALRNSTPKNSNQMDSPLRSRGYNTRSKNQGRDLWRAEINGKENGIV